MNTTIVHATEYRDLPLAMLTESATNPRRTFEDNALKELAETIRSQGVLSPLLVRPISDRSFEIVFGARRYRAAQMAEVATVPVRIKNLTDAEVLEAQLVENLIQYVPDLAMREQAVPSMQPILNAFPIPNGIDYRNWPSPPRPKELNL